MYRSILVPIDLGHESSWRSSLPVAVEYARAHKSEVHLITVVPDFGMTWVSVNFPSDYEAHTLEESGKALKAFMASHVPGDIAAHCHVVHGTIYSEIISAADRLGCDLIVLASHRPEMKDYLIGPNASRVVRHARQSVFVVRE